MGMTVSEIRRMYSQSKNKMSELSILADLNECTVEKIAELVADIPIDDEIAQKRVDGIVNGNPYIHHRDSDKERIGFYNRFATNLKKAMDKKNVSINSLARMANTSKSAIGAYVNAHRIPDVLTLYKMSKALKVSADEILGIRIKKGED